MSTDERLLSSRFPRSAKYDPDWLIAGVSGGANSLWLTEWLAEGMHLKPGMRVLDLGCGRGASSIFLSREFGVQVWSTDLWFDVSERSKRIQDAGVQDSVFPIHADARSLPFAREFFDAVLSIDSFVYYGTDDCYLNYVSRFLKPGGRLAIAGAGLVQEFEDLPNHLRGWWEPGMNCLHSAAWWKKHWERSGVVEVESAETLADGWKLWLEWQRAVSPGNDIEIKAIESDAGRTMGYVRAISRRRPEASLEEPIASIHMEYTRQNLLRSPSIESAMNQRPTAND